MITLKALTADDWQLWRELRLQALRDDPSAFHSKLADWQGSGDTELRWRERLTMVPLNITAWIEGKPAGMVGATPDEDGAAELISMWVAPFARGCGVGDAMIEAALRWAQEQGYLRVELIVTDANVHAKRLYARHGFADGGIIDKHSADAPDERLMICTLTRNPPSGAALHPGEERR